MDGPERLEDDARPVRRRTWVVVAVALVVVAGLGVVRLTGLAPDPAPPTSPSPAVGRTPYGWPRGLGTGTLYVLDSGGVVTIDLGSGLVQRAGLHVDPTEVTMTAGGFGVLVWREDGRGTPHLVAPGVSAPDSPTVTGLLAEGRQFLPGPGLDTWVSADDVGGDGDASLWRLVDETGRAHESRLVKGFVNADGSGGLFAQNGTHVEHVVPGQANIRWPGSVSAVGPDGWEELRCDDQPCTDVLHDRLSEEETPLEVATPDDFGQAALSPANRFVAATVSVSGSDDSPVVVRVAVPGSRADRRPFASPEDGSSFTWVSYRWLVATSQRGLVLYDAVDDRLVTPDVGLSLPRLVVFRPA